MDETNLPKILADDFARRFSMRAGNLMWFLGAGASASAGIPTAGDMIWDFKQRLFISQRRVSPKAIENLSSPEVRAQIQAHIDACGTLPADGATDEYAALFEAVYPSEADRRTYLDAKIAGAKPSFGHLALATLMRAEHTRIVWTTNFDPLIADACAKIYGGTGPLTTIDLRATDSALQGINEGRWPIEIKIHGDFRFRRLKAAGNELLHQDAQLRSALVDSCRRFGLVVAGYSGRDASVMDALEEVLNSETPFPSGLFWLHRGGNPPFTRVVQFLTRAAAKKIEAGLVVVENFDETLRDLIRLTNPPDAKALDAFAGERRRWSAAPRPASGGGWPVIRLNALPIIMLPSVCRRVVCQVGGYIEARKAVEDARVNVLVARTKAGVLAFGADSDVRTAFEAFDISDFSLHTIETRRLRYESGERGLLRDALMRAIVRQRGLDIIRKRTTDLLAPIDPNDAVWSPLKSLVGSLHGVVQGRPELLWREGLATRLDWADDRLWLLVEPRIVFGGLTPNNKSVAASFARERTVRRYNRQLNDLISFWSSLLAGDGGELRAFGLGDGVDAVFRLSGDNAYSRRCRP